MAKQRPTDAFYINLYAVKEGFKGITRLCSSLGGETPKPWFPLPNITLPYIWDIPYSLHIFYPYKSCITYARN